MSDDSLFREVDEAVRREQLGKLWDKYGLYVLAVALAIVVGVAGYKGWTYWQERRAAEAGARFVGALTLAEEGKVEEARAVFAELARSGPAGYRLLSRFQLAAVAAASSDKAAAVEAYDRLAEEAGEPILRDYARIRAAMLRIDEADMSEMTARVGDIARGASHWRHSARELLGMTAYRAGDMEAAERYFSEAMSDPAAPPGVRQRAEVMLALIVKADGAAAN